MPHYWFHDSGYFVWEPRAQRHLEGVMDDDNIGGASGVPKSNGKFPLEKKQKKHLWVSVLVTEVLVRPDEIGSAGCC